MQKKENSRAMFPWKIDVSIIFDVVHFVSDLYKQVLSGPRLSIPGENKRKKNA